MSVAILVSSGYMSAKGILNHWTTREVQNLGLLCYF